MTRLTVNGRARVFRGHPFTRLIDVLREGFGLTGTKEGCGEGECGACTVLVDGRPVMSCLVPVCQVEGRRVETIEALGGPERLAPLQQALLEEGGAQCGICTPGMVMTARAWVKGGGSSRTAAIREALGRQPLPLHRLPAHRGCGGPGGPRAGRAVGRGAKRRSRPTPRTARRTRRRR